MKKIERNSEDFLSIATRTHAYARINAHSRQLCVRTNGYMDERMNGWTDERQIIFR